MPGSKASEGRSAVGLRLVRWGGLAGLVAGVAFAVAGLLVLVTPSREAVFDAFGDYLFKVILVVAFGLPLVAIAGLHALQCRRYGPLGMAGFLLTFLGYALTATITAVSVLVGSEALYSVRLVGGFAVLIGSILLGAMTLRARVLPWWCGVLLIVGFPLGDVADALIGEGSEAIVLGVVWGLVGYALLSGSRVPDNQSVRVS
jgi:hypothetical protein